VQYANTLLKHKVLFGTDNPVISPDRWLEDFEKLPIKAEVRPLIMKENAVKLLKLNRAGYGQPPAGSSASSVPPARM
jgi:predicted TIM-barrel fold metal-dependent hydrolase